jgi:hypothetical protein
VSFVDQYRDVNMVNDGQASGDWTHCLYVTAAKYIQWPTCSQGVTVTEEVSGGAGYSAPDISVAVGFDVSYSKTISTSDEVEVDPGGSGWFDMGFRYQKYSFGMEMRVCIVPGSCLAWSSPTATVAQNYLGPTYAYMGTGAVG